MFQVRDEVKVVESSNFREKGGDFLTLEGIFNV